MFWIIIAVLVVVGLALIVYPLLFASNKTAVLSRADANRSLYHSKVEELQFDLDKGLLDQAEYDDSIEDLQRTLLVDVDSGERDELHSSKSIGLVAVVVVVLPLSAVLMYMQFSTADKAGNVTPQQAQQSSQVQSLEASISKLEQRLSNDPNNGEGWKMLGQSYFVLQQYKKAIGAYSKASELVDHRDPNLMVLMAEASAFANNEHFGEYENKLLSSALAINPKHERGLWYSGYAAYIASNFTEAAKHWDVLLELVPNGRTDVRDSLLKFLNDARTKAGLDVVATDQLSSKDNSSSSSQRAIKVTVQLSNELKDKVSPADTLFIYARAAEGPKMPLSLSRLTVADLPATVTLTEDMAMMQNMTMASFDQVQAVARISKSGQAITQSGDFIAQGILVDFTKSSNAEVSLSIDSIVE